MNTHRHKPSLARAAHAGVADDSEESLVFTVACGERITLDHGDAPLAIRNCAVELQRYLDWCRRARVVPRDLTQ